MKVAVYVRVSKDDGVQDTENQIIELRRFAAASDWDIAHEYHDHASAKSGDRKQFQAMLTDATRRKFDAVLVWALDRFTREGIEKTFDYIRALKASGVDFISYSEAHFRTTGPTGELMLAIAAWIAQQERRRISERTKAGLARVRAAGKVLGAPRVEVDRGELTRLRSEGHGARAIAERMGLKKSRVHQELQAIGLAGAPPQGQKSEFEAPEVGERAETAGRGRPRRRAAEFSLPDAAEPIPETPLPVVPIQQAETPAPKALDSWQ